MKEIAPVIGKITAAFLYISLGDMERYDNAGIVAKALGLNLKEHSSGNHKGLVPEKDCQRRWCKNESHRCNYEKNDWFALACW